MFPDDDKFKILGGVSSDNGFAVKVYAAMPQATLDMLDKLDDTSVGWKTSQKRSAQIDLAELATVTYNKIRMIVASYDPKTQESIKKQKESFELIFAQAGLTTIFFEERPNERFQNDPYGLSKPWYRITTPFGHILFGWRKSVINIDWKDTTLRIDVNGYSRVPTGQELFPNEDVTRFETGIHAWGAEKATEYLKKLHSHWLTQNR